MTAGLVDMGIRFEQDIVAVRGRIRRAAALLGFDPSDQARLGAAVSEIARNALQHGGGGRVRAEIAGDSGTAELAIVVEDHGPGMEAPEEVLDASAGGLLAVRRLLRDVEVVSSVGDGTRVRLRRRLPRGAVPDRARLHEIAQELSQDTLADPFLEIRRQNEELVRALQLAAQRQEELTSLNRELDDTNRGVLALYAELDARAESLRKANELRGRVLSQVSHEFRTPLNAIASLARLLDEETDGPLVPEQRVQVRHILKSGLELIEMVNDLLDLAKVDAGKLEARMAPFEVEALFGALRGMFRPLLPPTGAVSLSFEQDGGAATLVSDESKVSQILRNLISNAVKFTDRGEVQVRARRGPGDSVVFSVQDTGIGIAAPDLPRIFEEFSQVDQPLQRRVHGTGLGLPLSRRLAALLGGRIEVESTPNVGSTFRLLLPLHPMLSPHAPQEGLTDGARVLVVDDEEEGRAAARRALSDLPVRILEAGTAEEALRVARAHRPEVVILDLGLPDAGGETVLEGLRADPDTRDISILVFTSKQLRGADRVSLAKADGVFSKGSDGADGLRTSLLSLWNEVEADR
ncbi:MAG TPA: ATP-binding protein [Candidatus Polarisedimenticolaceae bacterium]|nr:ATP-binding protein [Candidatus Polarisedimenticolaceae bacterium]